LEAPLENQTLEIDEDKLMKMSRSRKLNSSTDYDGEASVSIDLESIEFMGLEPKRMVKFLFI
jgi:hypothetical protein